MVLPCYNAAVRHVAGVISWRGRNEWSLSPQASYGETLMNLCPYSIAHNTWLSINDSRIYWSWTYFQKDWWTAVQCFRVWNPIQLISSALNLLQASYLINTQISIFPLNSKTFHLNTTYEEVENFNQIRKKKKYNEPATAASNPHQTSTGFCFGSIRFISPKMEFLSLCRLSFFFPIKTLLPASSCSLKTIWNPCDLYLCFLHALL